MMLQFSQEWVDDTGEMTLKHQARFWRYCRALRLEFMCKVKTTSGNKPSMASLVRWQTHTDTSYFYYLTEKAYLPIVVVEITTAGKPPPSYKCTFVNKQVMTENNVSTYSAIKENWQTFVHNLHESAEIHGFISDLHSTYNIP